MMMIYLVILTFVAVMILWNLFTEKDFMLQLNATLVLIPLILRLLLLK